MSELEEQIKAAVGTAGFFFLMKLLKRFEISFDPEDKQLYIYKDGQEPVGIAFDLIEDFVNNVH